MLSWWVVLSVFVLDLRNALVFAKREARERRSLEIPDTRFHMFFFFCASFLLFVVVSRSARYSSVRPRTVACIIEVAVDLVWLVQKNNNVQDPGSRPSE